MSLISDLTFFIVPFIRRFVLLLCSFELDESKIEVLLEFITHQYLTRK